MAWQVENLNKRTSKPCSALAMAMFTSKTYVVGCVAHLSIRNRQTTDGPPR